MNVSGGLSTVAEEELATMDAAADAAAPLIRKGKTLHEYVMKWFKTTRQLVEKQISYLPSDCEIIAKSSSIKCLKCDSIIKTAVDDNGFWKISRFVSHHLRGSTKLLPSRTKQSYTNLSRIQRVHSK